jgi:hypothetical protein
MASNSLFQVEGRVEKGGCLLHLQLFSHGVIQALKIIGRRTKPLRGRNKGWCEAPFF